MQHRASVSRPSAFGGGIMTQYTHTYIRSEACNNFLDANGVQRHGTCQHTESYYLPHCAACGHPKDHSIHKEPQQTYT
jgi:hypothetical protein